MTKRPCRDSSERSMGTASPPDVAHRVSTIGRGEGESELLPEGKAYSLVREATPSPIGPWANP